ncbi:MAG: PEP-CTERM-box response regulator transcription factor [Geothermobacteraceae bacterium]
MKKLLVIEDNAEIRKQLKWGLGYSYSLFLAEDGEEGRRLFREQKPPVVILDLGLPPDPDGVEEGFRCLSDLVAMDATVKVIVITGRGEREHALRAIEAGAYDFYSKPVEIKELEFILGRAFYLAGLEKENRDLHLGAASGNDELGMFLGECPAMQEVQSSIRKVAGTDVPVLVLGESGTGKEMVARALHALSSRRDGPFVAINCGAIPETLLEAELFGHEKGAFTGAVNKVLGKVETASGGTLFLDEIGEMPPALQVKLLRFLQDNVIQRIGGRCDIPVDVRVVAATNQDIAEAIADGRFREDLYYRISVLTIDLPPLRDRGEDIELLGRHFLHRYAEQFNRRVRTFGEKALRCLYQHSWAGNVRELENRIKRAVVMADGPIIEPEDLGFTPECEPVCVSDAPAMRGGTFIDIEEMADIPLKEARAKFESRLIARVFEEEGGQMVKTAERLGVSRPTLYDLMKKYGLMGSS